MNKHTQGYITGLSFYPGLDTFNRHITEILCCIIPYASLFQAVFKYHTHTHTQHTNTHSTHTHTHTHTHTAQHTHTQPSTHTHTHTHTQPSTHTHTHTHSPAHTYTELFQNKTYWVLTNEMSSQEAAMGPPIDKRVLAIHQVFLSYSFHSQLKKSPPCSR